MTLTLFEYLERNLCKRTQLSLLHAVASQENKFYNSQQRGYVIAQVMHNTLRVNEAGSVTNRVEYFKQGGDKW